MDSCRVGTLGGTFSGNALACASALEVIKIMEKYNLSGRAAKIGMRFREFMHTLEKYGVIGDVRGIGAMTGVELVRDIKTKEPYPELTAKLIQTAAQNGLIIENAGTYGNVIRFLCPLVVTDEQLEAGLKIFENALAASLNAVWNSEN